MNINKARKNLSQIVPLKIKDAEFVRAYNTLKKTEFKQNYLFESEWSFRRGYRYNFKETHPVLYLAGDHLIASAEIGPRTYEGLLLPRLKMPDSPFIYFSVHVTARVLDLTDKNTRELLGIQLVDILIPTKEWDDKMDKGIWSVTHKIGKLTLEDDRFDGILYPSYPSTVVIKSGDKHNLALFMDPESKSMSKPMSPEVKIEVIDNNDFLKNLGLIY